VEERERAAEAARVERDLQARLHEAQMAKAKIQRAEMNAAFTK